MPTHAPVLVKEGGETIALSKDELLARFVKEISFLPFADPEWEYSDADELICPYCRCTFDEDYAHSTGHHSPFCVWANAYELLNPPTENSPMPNPLYDQAYSIIKALFDNGDYSFDELQRLCDAEAKAHYGASEQLSVLIDNLIDDTDINPNTVEQIVYQLAAEREGGN